MAASRSEDAAAAPVLANILPVFSCPLGSDAGSGARDKEPYVADDAHGPEIVRICERPLLFDHLVSDSKQ
jgi:hypothetical protein